MPDHSIRAKELPLPDEQTPTLPLHDYPFISDDSKSPDITSDPFLDNLLPHIDLDSSADPGAALLVSEVGFPTATDIPISELLQAKTLMLSNTTQKTTPREVKLCPPRCPTYQ